MEVLDAYMEVARYSAKCLTKEEALEAYEGVSNLPKLSVVKKTDVMLDMARVCSFCGDWERLEDTFEKVSWILLLVRFVCGLIFDSRRKFMRLVLCLFVI